MLPVMTTFEPMRRWSAMAARPAEHHPVADDRRAGDARLAADQAGPADPDVVADLDLVVDLGAVADVVSAMVPRSMQLLAPTSTSSPITTAPSELIRT